MLYKILVIFIVTHYACQRSGGKRVYIAHDGKYVSVIWSILKVRATRQEFRRYDDNTIRNSNGDNCVYIRRSTNYLRMQGCDQSLETFAYDAERQTYTAHNGSLCWGKPTIWGIKVSNCQSTEPYGFLEVNVNDELTSMVQPSTPPLVQKFTTTVQAASSQRIHSSKISGLLASTPTLPSSQAVPSSAPGLDASTAIPPSSQNFRSSVSGLVASTPIPTSSQTIRSSVSGLAAVTPNPSMSQTVRSSVSAVNKTSRTSANGLYLASPGEQCQEFCQRIGLLCFTSIATGNTDAAFSNTGVTCKDSETHKFWRQPYDPSYRVNESVCAGYMNLNESGIKCSVIGFDDANIRRLCKCIRSADEDKFTLWVPWSSCSLSCNGGIQTRERFCNELSCVGPTKDSRRCNTQPCPIDGGFSDWSPWSSCTVTCGGGQKSQTRTCTNPKPDHGGLDCFGDKERTDKCNSLYCPVHGNWTEWTEWSACDKPCNDGRIKRWRYCTNPVPLYGGRACSGQPTDEKHCNKEECPVETITVENVRFYYNWNETMQTRSSLAFKQFTSNLQVNVGRIFQYSVVNSSYQKTAVSNLRKGSVISSFTLYFTALDSFQTLLLQEAIEDDKYIGKMKILGFNNTYKTAIVPGTAPLNFTLTPLSATSVRAEWMEVPASYRNGNISGYILFYREKILRNQPYESIATDRLSVILQGLKIYTEYTFRVLAYNKNGNGIATLETHIFTEESVPAIPPYNVTGKSPTGFTAIIEWIHIPQYKWNGVPVGTLVKFSDGNGHAGNVTVGYPTTSATLTDLIPITTYVIDVCELTLPGPGPCQRLQVTTNPSPPSRSPENVTIDDKTSHNQLGLSWNRILPTYVHGDLLGYKVLYTLTKIAGNAIVVQTTKVKTVHPSLNTVIINGLKANAQYSIQVLAFNAYGDGVASDKSYGETCACTPVIHTNYAASAPYMYRDSSGKRQGLLVDILENATRYVCSACKRPTATIIDYVNNGKNGWAEKRSLTEVKKDIDNYIEISFPAFGSTALTTYYGFPFTPVFSHPGVVYYIIKDSMNDLVVKMMRNVFNTWPIFLINVLLVIISGYIVWAMEFNTHQSDFPNKCLPGVLNGVYWAFITMGTHGYGDLTPRGIASRIFAIIWILVGMVNLAIFTGALTTAITAAQVYDDPMMYGVEVAAVHDSAAYRIAILRNAKVNTKANYSTIEDVSSALKQRQVRGALVDIFSAATRSDLFLQSDIIAKKSFEYPSAYGFVLSGDMKNAAPEFRRYLNSQADRILAFMKKKSAGLEVNMDSGKTVSMFDKNSPILARVLVAISASFVVLFIAGTCYHFYLTKRKRDAIIPSTVHVVRGLEELCEESLSQFEESITKKMSKQFNDQLKERMNALFKCKSQSILNMIPYFRLRSSRHQKVQVAQVIPGPSHTEEHLDKNK